MKYKLMKVVVSLFVTFGLFFTQGAVVFAEEADSLNCKNTQDRNLVDEGCIMHVSDAAYYIGPTPINPSVTKCFNSNRDSVSSVKFPKISKTGQLDGMGVVPFEISYHVECLTWKDAISIEAFLTDIHGERISLGVLDKSERSYRCSAMLDCWPGYFTVITFSGNLDVSRLNTKGYYKFSIEFSRSFAHATATEKYYMNEPLLAKLEYSNQLWLGERIKPTPPAISESPVVADCFAEKTIQFKTTSKTQRNILNKEQGQVKSFLKAVPKGCNNGEKLVRVICYGNYWSSKNKSVVEARAKSFCGYVKKLYPDITYWDETAFFSEVAKGNLTVALEALYSVPNK